MKYATWIGKCGTPRIRCGAYCFVNPGDCPDQKYFPYAGQYMSCLPCDQPRNAQPLKKAECPNDASGLIGTGIGILAAGILLMGVCWFVTIKVKVLSLAGLLLALI